MEPFLNFDPSFHGGLPKVTGLWEEYKNTQLNLSGWIRRGVNGYIVAAIFSLNDYLTGRKHVIVEGQDMIMMGEIEDARKNVDTILKNMGYTLVN